jgi:hypothetical protein
MNRNLTQEVNRLFFISRILRHTIVSEGMHCPWRQKIILTLLKSLSVNTPWTLNEHYGAKENMPMLYIRYAVWKETFNKT